MQPAASAWPIFQPARVRGSSRARPPRRRRPAARWSSSAATLGSATGRVANAPSRDGCRRTVSAAMSFARLLSGNASAVSSGCVPGGAKERIWHVDSLSVLRRDPGVADVVKAFQVVTHLIEHDAVVRTILGKSLHGRVQLGHVPVSPFNRRDLSLGPFWSGRRRLYWGCHSAVAGCRRLTGGTGGPAALDRLQHPGELVALIVVQDAEQLLLGRRDGPLRHDQPRQRLCIDLHNKAAAVLEGRGDAGKVPRSTR